MNDLNRIGSCTGRLTPTKVVSIRGFRLVSQCHSWHSLKFEKKNKDDDGKDT